MNTRLRSPLHAGVVALVAASLGVMGTSAQASHRTSHASLQTLRWNEFLSSNLALAATLDPAYVQDSFSAAVILPTHVGLVQNLPNGKVAPQLASKITVSGGGKVYTFQMNHWKFADGYPITAADVVWSIKRALRAPGSGVNYYDEAGYGDIQGADDYANGKSNALPGVKVLGTHVVQITITKPIAYFLQALTSPINMPLDPGIAGRKPASADNNYLTENCPAARADSSGQFTFQCSGSAFFPSGTSPQYTLVPNPMYVGHRAKLKLEIGVAGTDTTDYNEYLTGKVDQTGHIPPQFLPRSRANPRGQLWHGALCPKPTSGCPTTSTHYIQIDTTAAPFDNVNCRLAVAWGLDRSREAKLYNGAEKPLYTITPPGLGIMTPRAVANITGKVPRYNLAKAKSYAAKCPAAKKRTSFTFVYPTEFPTFTDLALEVVRELQTLGFTGAQPRGLPTYEWVTDNGTPMGKTGVTMIEGGWAQDYSDPEDYISLLFKCGAAFNIGEFCDKTFTRMTRAADLNHNVKLRTQQYLNAQVRLLNEGYPIMLFNDAQFGLIKPYVHGLSWSVSLSGMAPANNDWSKVSIAKH